MSYKIKYNKELIDFTSDLCYVDDILNIGNRVGGTDYIDFISFTEVTKPIMKGYDCYGRPFMVLKLNINGENVMQTFFKRYTNGTGWMGCGHATKRNIIRTDGGMTDVQYKLLSDFIQLKKINITEEHRPYSSSFIGEYTPYIQDDIIMMFSHNYIDAILKIQAQWRKCRYNQQYYLCRKIMDDNYTNIVN